ncbi:MAG: hypothetical protein ACK4X1_07260 [Terricaulis sp.]
MLTSIVDLMPRLWLSLLTAFVLAASGVSTAVAAEACPMQQAAAAQAQHDCCPDQGGDKNQPQQQDDMDGCVMGMACRTASAVAPTFAPIVLPNATILMSAPRLSEPARLSGPLQDLFRPPRTT